MTDTEKMTAKQLVTELKTKLNDASVPDLVVMQQELKRVIDTELLHRSSYRITGRASKRDGYGDSTGKDFDGDVIKLQITTDAEDNLRAEFTVVGRVVINDEMLHQLDDMVKWLKTQLRGTTTGETL